MSSVYELPPILSGSAENQLRQLRDYLVRMARWQTDESAAAAVSAETAQRQSGTGGGSDGQDVKTQLEAASSFYYDFICFFRISES